MNDNNTIYALSSAYGKAGVSIFRISGKNSYKILQKITKKKEFIPNKMIFSSMYHPKTGDLIDQGMVVFFKGPNSYTGEDTVELFIHGSIAVINSIYDALYYFSCARIATPGEFTKQAFLNNKIDLTEVEAISDLIDAETLSQQKLALSNINGISSKLYNKWRDELVKILAWYEASIDFQEDEIPENILAINDKKLRTFVKEMKEHVKTSSIAKKIKYGLNVAIIGKPNVGKSSLFNKLLGENKAIVSNIAGTTRDVIEAAIDIDGFKINIADTAGLNKNTKDKIEKIGIEKAIEYTKNADLKIYVTDNEKDILNITTDENSIVVLNKIDTLKNVKIDKLNLVTISVKTGKNWNDFIKLLKEKIHNHFNLSDDITLTQTRYKTAINNCINYLNIAIKENNIDLKTEDIRLACNEIGVITGKIYFNELLDNIFSNFCLGK